MLRSDFYYDLPQELIAQTPLEPRDSSRLMKIDRISGEITHDRFYNICDYLEKGDLLVLNEGLSRKALRRKAGNGCRCAVSAPASDIT